MDKIFRKDVTYGNIKSQKHPGFTVFLEDTFSENQRGGRERGGGGGQIDLLQIKFYLKSYFCRHVTRKWITLKFFSCECKCISNLISFYSNSEVA